MKLSPAGGLATLFDDGRVEVTFSTSGSALGSTKG